MMALRMIVAVGLLCLCFDSTAAAGSCAYPNCEANRQGLLWCNIEADCADCGGVWCPETAQSPASSASSASGRPGEGIFVIGGTNFDDWDMDRVELQANTTTPWEMQVSLQDKRASPAAASHGGVLYAIGGSLLSQVTWTTTVFDSVEMLDTSDPAGEWSYGPSLQTARHSCAAATINGVIYASGGYSGGGMLDFNALASVEMLDANNLTSVWSDVPPLQTARALHAAAALNGMLYVIGGYPSGADSTGMSASGGNLLATVEILDTSDLAGGGWSYGPPLQTTRAGHAAVALNGMLYVIGGVDGGWVTFSANIEILDTNNLAGGWSDGPPLQTARQYIVAAPLHGMICVIGGWNAPQNMGGSYLATVELLDPSDLAAGWSYGLNMNYAHESHAGAAFNVLTGDEASTDSAEDIGGASTLSMSLCFTTLLAAVVTVFA